MARKLRFADELKRYEARTAASHEAAHKTQIKVDGFEGNADRAGGAPKKRKKGRKSSK